MNQRIKIYSRQSSTNSYGEQSDVYAQSGSVFGRAKHSVSNESLVSDKHQPTHKLEIASRYFSGTSGDQIEYAGFRWEVEGVRRRYRSNNITIIANRLHVAVAEILYYLQPDGSSYYLQPSGDKYLQP